MIRGHVLHTASFYFNFLRKKKAIQIAQYTLQINLSPKASITSLQNPKLFISNICLIKSIHLPTLSSLTALLALTRSSYDIQLIMAAITIYLVAIESHQFSFKSSGITHPFTLKLRGVYEYKIIT